jgi:uncharacterized lipoprotein YajG
MQLKPVAVITVLLLLSATLLIAGCTTSTTTNYTQNNMQSNANAPVSISAIYIGDGGTKRIAM